jgi:hypothetical protein
MMLMNFADLPVVQPITRGLFKRVRQGFLQNLRDFACPTYRKAGQSLERRFVKFAEYAIFTMS